MSLLKLLSAGKSLVGVKNTASPYRMRSANLLPKFGSPKNPFESLPRTEPLNKPAAPVVTAPVAAPTPAPAPVEAITVVKPKSEAMPVSIPVRAESVLKDFKKPAATQKIKYVPKAEEPAPAPVEESEKGSSIVGWVKKLNPLAHLPKREPGNRSPQPAGGRTPVQGELSLEKVRVMRNELNDSDLEFIASKPVVSQAVSGTILPQKPRLRLITWGRLTSRVTGVMETQTQ